MDFQFLMQSYSSAIIILCFSWGRWLLGVIDFLMYLLSLTRHRRTCYWNTAVLVPSKWSTLAARATLTSAFTRTSNRDSTARPKSSSACLTVRPSTCGVSVRVCFFFVCYIYSEIISTAAAAAAPYSGRNNRLSALFLFARWRMSV